MISHTYDIRSNAHVPIPQIAVVKVDKDGVGEDVAWVFSEEMARRISQFLQNYDETMDLEPKPNETKQ